VSVITHFHDLGIRLFMQLQYWGSNALGLGTLEEQAKQFVAQQ